MFVFVEATVIYIPEKVAFQIGPEYGGKSIHTARCNGYVKVVRA